MNEEKIVLTAAQIDALYALNFWGIIQQNYGNAGGYVAKYAKLKATFPTLKKLKVWGLAECTDGGFMWRLTPKGLEYLKQFYALEREMTFEVPA